MSVLDTVRGWFGAAPEQRATFKEVDFWLRDGWIAQVSSGVSVTAETAIKVPDVYAAIGVLAQDVGRCPLKLRVNAGDGWRDADSHPLWEVLHDLPNPEMTAVEFRALMMRQLFQHEVAYAEIVRRPDGVVRGLWPLDSARMTVTRDSLNRKVYVYRMEHGAPMVWTFDADRPPLFELRHPSPIHQCRDLIGLAIAMDTYAGKFFANGARMSGLIVSKAGLKPEQKQGIRESFSKLYGGVNNAHRVGVLEGDLEFKPLTSPNDEAQFHESRKLVRSMIAGAFRVPSHKINDLERATFSNIEAQDRDYVNSGLDPYLVLWEQALRRDVLTTRQYPRYQVMFDREALIQADMQSRAMGFAQGRQNGWYSVNDIRTKLGENPVPEAQGGNDYHMNGNMTRLAEPVTSTPDTPAPEAEDAPLAAEPEQVM
jgi:HK97 family phage portal protein